MLEDTPCKNLYVTQDLSLPRIVCTTEVNGQKEKKTLWTNGQYEPCERNNIKKLHNKQQETYIDSKQTYTYKYTKKYKIWKRSEQPPILQGTCYGMPALTLPGNCLLGPVLGQDQLEVIGVMCVGVKPGRQEKEISHSLAKLVIKVIMETAEPLTR